MRKLSLMLLLICLAIAAVVAWFKLSSRYQTIATTGNAAKSQQRPPSPPAPMLVNAIPVTINIPQGISGPVEEQPFFDYFSWESFLALMWPAAKDARGVPKRGVPDTQLTISDPGIRVWETWKSDWELFRPIDPSTNQKYAPTEWISWETNPANQTPCPNVNLKPGMHLLAKLTKLDPTIPYVNQAMAGPLFDQNSTSASASPVHYEILFNKTGYDTIRLNQWYAASNLPAQISFPTSPSVEAPGSPYGIIEVKAAWKIMDPKKDTDRMSRYYTEQAVVLDPGNNNATCKTVTIGLVGFHIGHKASELNPDGSVGKMAEWVWSTFEQVDNVPDGTPNQIAPYSFNNSSNNPSTNCQNNSGSNCGYDHLPARQKICKAFPDASPVQVSRVNPIAASTRQLNSIFQRFLTSTLGHSTVWQYYQLIATQWPTIENGKNFDPNGSYPKASDSPFPQDNVANVTAETYFQQSQQTATNSCMSCHFMAAARDFSWTLIEESLSPKSCSALAFETEQAKVSPPRARAPLGETINLKALSMLQAATEPK